ncbi:IS3 family transposase [Bacillus toyonensis]|uniref:IS3 family transposase n=1 Tax=Bacillus toyonensis TaxID=155322 RepID=UPI0020D26B8C|nr:IS3 family transposase [Bacillus toyonensis]
MGGVLAQTAKYESIEELRSQYKVTWLVIITQLNRSSYYKWRSTCRQRQLRLLKDYRLSKQIQAIHIKRKEYGYPRMKVALQEAGFLVNHMKVYRLMRELQIQSIIRKKRRFFKGKSSKIFPNVVEQQFRNRKQNEVLVTDITSLPFKDKFLYLSVVQDIYNNEIVAWKLSNRNDLQLVLKTLDLATQKRDVYGTIIHSDQGFQYTSRAYCQSLQQLGAIGSHSRKGNCHDNACIESFFSHFKSEMFNLNSYQNEKELVQAIETYIYHYNYKRFQKRLHYRAPIEYRISMAA